MKAIQVYEFGGPEVLRLEEIPDVAPSDEDVLVRVHAIGVNPVETYIRSGTYAQPPLPFIPGTDAAGVVERVGALVEGFKQGDRVYTSGSVTGTYAELTVCRPEQLYPLPINISFEQGAALGIPYGTAFRALFQRGHALPGEVVLIHGASGGVGLAAVQFARAAGLRVIGTGGTPEGRELILEAGAHAALDHNSADYLKVLMDWTGGRGVELVVEMLANVNLGKDLKILTRHGRVVVVGSRGETQVNARDAMMREADVRGVLLSHATEQERFSMHSAIVNGLENKTLRPVIGARFPLAEAARAHEAILKPGAYGKIVLSLEQTEISQA
jgi:NADPH:quinone reductase